MNHPPITRSTLNRRAFLKASAAAAMTAALAVSGLPASLALAQDQDAMSDIDILNYALTLEHLESRAYQDVTTIGMVTGRNRELFVEFGNQEASHVVALTGTITRLGGTPVRALANYNWPDFQSEQEVLEYFYATEELGAAAYLGQVGNIRDKDLLTAAVSIHNVEGQHAAILGELTGRRTFPAFAPSMTMQQVIEAIAPIIDSTPAAMPSTGLGGMELAPGLGPQIAR